MPIILDHQLREHIPHNAIEFPITYYHDELVTLPDRTGPLHWHPDFEIATAEFEVLDYQVGCQTADYLGRFPQIISDGNTCHSLRSMRQKHIISGVTADYRGLISVQLWLD